MVILIVALIFIIYHSSPQVSGWEVICEDTVLFPEGGGQNSDHGEMAGRKVLQVVMVMVVMVVDSMVVVKMFFI